MPEVPTGRIPDRIRRLSENHNRQLQSLNRRARDAVERRLQQAAERVAARAEAIDPSMYRAQQDRVIQYLASLTETLTRAELEEVTAESVRSSFRLAPAQVEGELREWSDHYGLTLRPLNLQAIAELDREILIQRIPRSLERWGPLVAGRVQDELAVSLAERADTTTVVDRIQKIIGDRRFAADRIVRTEMQEAYNTSHHETLRFANDMQGAPAVKKSALATFDSRTDEDSFPVHGQVRELDEKFVDGDGREYLHPPGRPNDREKEIPWVEGEGAEIMSREEGIEQAQSSREALTGARQRLSERVRERVEEFADAGQGEALKEAALDKALSGVLPDKKTALTLAGAGLTVGGLILAVKTGQASRLVALADDLVRSIRKSGMTSKARKLFSAVVRRAQGLRSKQATNVVLGLPSATKSADEFVLGLDTTKDIVRPSVTAREAARVVVR